MKMISKKRFRKRVAIFLLLVLLIPFAPISSLSAASGSPFPFDYPSSDSFYPVDFVIRLFNCGDAYYLRVRTDIGLKIAYWRFLEQYTIPVTPDPFTKYTFYNLYGAVVDNPFVDTRDNNLLLFKGVEEDLIGGMPFGIVQASNTNLYAYDEGVNLAESDEYIYFYKNYSSLAATPTPTPIPITPNVIVMYGDYEPFQLGDIPNYGTDIYANGFEATGEVINIANALPGHQPTYASIFAGIDYDNYHSPFFGIYITDSDTMDNPLTGHQFDHIVYGPYTSVDGTVTKYVHYFIRAYSNHWSVYGKPNLDNVNVPQFHWENSGLSSVSSGYYRYLAGYGYCDFYGFNGQGNPNVSPTPTPNPSPTLMPQPSISPTPSVEPPDTGEDNNWTGLFGWLRRIRDSILNIPKKIVSGILDALKYIFLPDPEKVKGVFNTLNDKFGIQHPTKFTVDPNELFRPANVVWQFRPISLNGEETEAVDVTIINFEEVDEWLDSSPGMVITRILQAMFGITMFAYLIYIFTKHIATINYTDAHTLMHLDDPPQNQRGGRR